MSDDRIRDLLQSPLDQRSQMGGRALLFTIAATAMVAGAALVLAIGLLTADETEPGTLSQPITTTTSTAPTTTTPGFIPSGDRLGLRPDWVLVRQGRVYVSVTSAVTAGTEPSSVARMEAGLWLMGPEGNRVEFTTEYTDPIVTGRITVEFPAVTAIDDLQVIPGDTAPVSFQHEAPVTAMPFIGPLAEGRFPLVRAVELVIDDVAVGRTSGAITWHLEGGATERARVGIEVDFLDGEEVLGTVMTRHSQPFFAFLRETTAPPGPTRGGIAELIVPFGTSIDPDRVDTVVLRWSVDLFHYEQTPIEVPLEGITIVDADTATG